MKTFVVPTFLVIRAEGLDEARFAALQAVALHNLSAHRATGVLHLDQIEPIVEWDSLVAPVSVVDSQAPTSLLSIVRELALELRQIHAYHYSDCEGGCPTHAALALADKAIMDRVLPQWGRVEA